MTLDSRAQILLTMLNRIEVPPLPEQSLELARRNFHKLLHLYRDDLAPIGAVDDLVISRKEFAGGPIAARLYKPLGQRDSLPVLLWFHGGGWTMGNLSGYDGVCRDLANAAGCAVLAVDYRLAPESRFPAAVEDAWLSLRWLVKEGASCGLDIRRIAVGGDSAGGNLAAVLCHIARDEQGPQLAAQLLIYPSTDQLSERASHQRYGEGYFLDKASIKWFQRNYLPAESDYLDWRASPLRAKRFDGLPDAIIVTAGYDPLTDDAIAYGHLLSAAGIKVEHLHYSGMIHGFISMTKALPLAREALKDVSARLQAALYV